MRTNLTEYEYCYDSIHTLMNQLIGKTIIIDPVVANDSFSLNEVMTEGCVASVDVYECNVNKPSAHFRVIINYSDGTMHELLLAYYSSCMLRFNDQIIKLTNSEISITIFIKN